jgi:inhibitor of KinA
MNNNKKKWGYEFYPLGENGVVIQLGNEISLQTYNLVQAISRLLESQGFPGFLEHVPAFTSVTVYYDCLFFQQKGHDSPYENVCRELKLFLDNFVEVEENHCSRIVEIPVCYGGEFGPDLKEVAQYNGLSPEEVIAIHAAGNYFVYMIGFAPGFPYVGGLSEKIATPRKRSPRMNIPTGSVGIAGNQTGIYPLDTPGGWQIIGRTPLSLFRPSEKIPSFLRAGDYLRFVPISSTEYQLTKEGG